MARITELKIDVRPNNSWAEMGHFKLWSNGEVLNLNSVNPAVGKKSGR